MHNPELGLNLEQKLITNQQFHALKSYEKIGAKSGDCLEKILEWDGTVDEFSMETSIHFPNFSSNNLDPIEKRITLNSSHSFSVEETSLQDDTSGPNLGGRVIFLAYRMYNPTVRSNISLFRSFLQ